MKKESEPLDLQYRDMFGQPIKVGDYIVYGAVDGRSGTLRAGHVVALLASKPRFDGDDEPLMPKIRVRSWSNFRSRPFAGLHGDTKTTGRQKDVVLGFLDRLVVVDPKTISEKIKTDLAGPKGDWSGAVESEEVK